MPDSIDYILLLCVVLLVLPPLTSIIPFPYDHFTMWIVSFLIGYNSERIIVWVKR